MVRPERLTAGIPALVTVASALLFISNAEAKPTTKSFSCSGAKTFVRNHGAIVMSHKRPDLYRRFVSSSAYCDYDKSAQPFVVPTRTGKCQLRICKQRWHLFDHD